MLNIPMLNFGYPIFKNLPAAGFFLHIISYIIYNVGLQPTLLLIVIAYLLFNTCLLQAFINIIYIICKTFTLNFGPNYA